MRILWIPHASWHIHQRAHIFCNVMAERHEIHVTDWVADFARPRDYFSKRYLRNFWYHRDLDGKITVHGIPRISPAIYSGLLRRLNTRLYRNYVNWIIKHYRIEVVVGTFLVPPPQAPRLVFDLFDENVENWRSSYSMTAYADEIDRVEREYLAAADAVVAASSVLAEKAQAGGARGPIYLIPNGVDIERFTCANGQRFRRETGLKGRIVGMVGNHDELSELRKVLDAARLLEGQGITFLIAGRGLAMADAQRQAQQEGLSNVHFHGYVDPSQVPDLLAALEVGLCPYSKTPMADARSPLRLFEYAAAGLPVVCTDLLEVRRLQFPTVVLVDDSPQALADGIQNALRLPHARPPQIEHYDIRQLAEQYERVLM